MAYTRNRPLASDFVSSSQPTLLQNTNGADDSFGVDHYKFSDTTANNGFHNKVTTPLIIGSAHPATTTNPIFYAMQDTANIGVIQYSRGPSNAVPTPVTELHSPTIPISLAQDATANILDFTGIQYAIGTVYGFNSGSTEVSEVVGQFVYSFASGAPVFNISVTGSTTRFDIVSSSFTLQLKRIASATSNNTFWTLKFHRIAV